MPPRVELVGGYVFDIELLRPHLARSGLVEATPQHNEKLGHLYFAYITWFTGQPGDLEARGLGWLNCKIYYRVIPYCVLLTRMVTQIFTAKEILPTL